MLRRFKTRDGYVTFRTKKRGKVKRAALARKVSKDIRVVFLLRGVEQVEKASSIEGAKKRVRAYKRRGWTAWVEQGGRRGYAHRVK